MRLTPALDSVHDTVIDKTDQLISCNTSKKTMGFFCDPGKTIETRKTVILPFLTFGKYVPSKMPCFGNVLPEMPFFDPFEAQ